jgi:hypothetical protein
MINTYTKEQFMLLTLTACLRNSIETLTALSQADNLTYEQRLLILGCLNRNNDKLEEL